MSNRTLIATRIRTLLDRVKAGMAGMAGRPTATPAPHHGLVAVNRARTVARHAAVPAYRQRRLASRSDWPFRVEPPQSPVL